MTLLEQLDELQDSMNKLVSQSKDGEAAQDALEIVQHLQRISNSPDQIDTAHANMSIWWLFSDEGRLIRKDQSGN